MHIWKHICFHFVHVHVQFSKAKTSKHLFLWTFFSKYKKICLFISCFVENTNLLGCLSLQKLSPTCLSSVRKVDATEWNFEKMLIRPWWGRIKKIPVTYYMKFQTTRSLCIKLMCTCVSCNMSLYKYQSTKPLIMFPTPKTAALTIPQPFPLWTRKEQMGIP